MECLRWLLLIDGRLDEEQTVTLEGISSVLILLRPFYDCADMLEI